MFELIVKERAQKFLFKNSGKYRERIIKVLLDLQNNSIPYKTYDVKKLEGYENHFRIRIGKVRIIYEISAKEFLIKIHDIGFRENVY